MKVPTHQGYHYWVTFIDDFSRFKAVYLLKRKSETFATFKQFKAWAENVTGQKLGCLRDDKGGEYMSREFEAFCIDHGIQRQHSAQNCPQQNGVAERANRTLEEGIRSMLHESGMPPSFLVGSREPSALVFTFMNHLEPMARFPGGNLTISQVPLSLWASISSSQALCHRSLSERCWDCL